MAMDNTVTELIDAYPLALPTLSIRRREELLLAEPIETAIKLWPDAAPIEAVHFGQDYQARPFAPPREVYSDDHLRVEWQTMNNRQPFYHRNTDADELSFQIDGERTLMTEMGSVELRPGDFSLIPVGVCHDNYGRSESHLLFYLPAPVQELTPAVKTSQMRVPPYEGWQPAMLNEFVSDHLGSVEGGIVAFPTDEEMLLRTAEHAERRIKVQRGSDEPATTWLYEAGQVRIAETTLARSGGREYVRHRNCHEMQYQISGTRTLVTQRGTLHLEPGDFVSIPLGVAFTSITKEESRHITLLSGPALTRVSEASKKSERLSVTELAELRETIGH